MPLPNTVMIHPDWSKHHQPSVESAMRSTIDILIPLAEIEPGNPFDPNPADPATDVAVADVQARVRALADDSMIAPSGQTLDTQGYLVQIPVGAYPDLRVGKGDTAHRVRVTSMPEEPGLEGRVLQILAYPRGTEAFNGDLICQEHVNQQQT